MTYIEVIVVLSIFAMVSSVVMYNYGDFQDRVDIKNLASDVALKIVEAQKSSLSGLLPSVSVSSLWKPAYGVYFKTAPASEKSRFIYFVDADGDKFFDGANCSGECLNNISITKNNLINQLKVYYSNGTTALLPDLAISFVRPNSDAIMVSGTSAISAFSQVEITVLSPKGAAALIAVYPSGRIEIK
jgi:type II secretory pathway pseudopilin PulG